MEVPGYTEIRELGHGGTGRVMLAVRDSDGLHVAIKHLSGELREDEAFVARFREEARLIQEIDSPHTARVLDYVEGDDDAVIVMELVDGVTLRRLLSNEGATGPQAALSVLKGSLLGLAEAHRHGVVHRDFKPENVMITQEGESKLVDFGVAARVGETGVLAGTPSYMAPEQWDEAPAGPATDVYAATLVFYECLTGHRAFHGENIAALAYQHQHLPPPIDDIEAPLRPLIEHGLAKDPAQRPESALAFLEELEDTARTAYGSEWEERGRARMAALVVPLAGLLPKPPAVPEPGTGTSLFHSALSPAGKLAMTGGLVVATAVAVVSTFAILGDAPDPRSVTEPPPATVALPPPTTPAPSSPSPSPTRETPTPEPTRTEASPTASEPTALTPAVTSPVRPVTRPPVVSRPTTPPTTRPTTQPTTRPTTRPSQRPTTSRPTREPTRRPTRTSRPTRQPTADPTTIRPTPPRDDDPPAPNPPDTQEPPPPVTNEPEQPAGRVRSCRCR
ncbi:serine/threonine-protein kinase [Nonomuraea sp. N2-4H]|uniref:serine/threonine-protein kinase n=1 Tax=Nonomuraea sp. N2-4H TaxID=3128898 RepID=UPI0032554681